MEPKRRGKIFFDLFLLIFEYSSGFKTIRNENEIYCFSKEIFLFINKNMCRF